MVKFVSVFGITLLLLMLVTLMWPRFFDVPRPGPLASLNAFLRNTPVGQNTANVLGVSTEDSVQKLTPQSIVASVVTTAEQRALDVAITHIVREITRRFRDLPKEHQKRILEAIGDSISASSSGSDTQAP